jgi:hypothetical protein
MTSNQNNIALLNEFFFYLLRSIREEKSSEINQLMKEYWDMFSSSTKWDLADSFEELSESEEQLSIYRDRVI